MAVHDAKFCECLRGAWERPCIGQVGRKAVSRFPDMIRRAWAGEVLGGGGDPGRGEDLYFVGHGVGGVMPGIEPWRVGQARVT